MHVPLGAMTPELSTTEQMIYTTYRTNHGAVAAERWLKGYLERRNGSPVQVASNQRPLIPLAAPERPAEPSEPVMRRDTAALPLQEAVESFSARQVARVVADLNPWRCASTLCSTDWAARLPTAAVITAAPAR